ncbi:MAG: helix-hairpin-helix domain-containing protein [Blastocatellia bacterium]
MMKRTVTACVLLLALLGAATLFAQEQKGRKKNYAELMPPGEGKEIALASCTQCHGLGELVSHRLSLKSWETVIADMAARGAQMLPGEAETLAAYLAQHYGPLVNVNQAAAAELATLPELNPALAEAIVRYREKNGPFASLDDLAAVEGMSQELLGKIRDKLTTTETTETKRKK